MSLAPGAKLGPYEILEPIGKGGMGEVYKAHDPRLRRDVAIKVSAARFNERFEREARAVAALNHPNICQIYDIGPNYLVMEYIEGPTLADRIREGAIPLDEALPIAEQMAAALEAAHEKAITHRDLKPANVKVKSDGVVKVLDFGLAKIGGAQPTKISEDSPTLSMAATQAGTVLGTAAYMAPEQARGKDVDKRADIWAFGVVLYEMVTGKRPFQGEDMVEMLAAVVHGQPDFAPVPVKVRRLVERCLEKDPKKRLRDITGIEFLLAEQAASWRAGPLPGKLPWIAAAGFAALAAGTAWTLWPQPKALLPMTKLIVDVGQRVGGGSGLFGPDAVLSPDGRHLAYAIGGRLYALDLDRPDASPVQLTAGGTITQPAFSADGNWIAFVQSGIKKVAAAGGSPLNITSGPTVRGFAWTEDGAVIASPAATGTPLLRIDGGDRKPVTQLRTGEISHRWPQLLPGDRTLIFTAANAAGTFDNATIEAQSLRSGERKTLARGGSFGRVVFASDGSAYLVYVNRGTLFAQPFDEDTLSVRGRPAVVLDGVGYGSVDGGALLDFSRTGTMIYQGGAAGKSIVKSLDATGRAVPVLVVSDDYRYPRVSPDGQRFAVVGTQGGANDLWVHELMGGRVTRLTVGLGANFSPTWTRDGKYLIYQVTGGIAYSRADGASQPVTILSSKNIQYPYSVSPDSKWLAFMEASPDTVYDLWTAPLELTSAGLKAGKPVKFVQTAADERHPALSPDGRWVAYASNESGQLEIYVRAFPDTGGRWTVSSGGGHYPAWSGNGRELFYKTEDGQVMVAPYKIVDGAFQSDPPHKFVDQKLAIQTTNTFDLLPDGRILGLLPSEDAGEAKAQSQVTFLIHFADEIARRVGAGR